MSKKLEKLPDAVKSEFHTLIETVRKSGTEVTLCACRDTLAKEHCAKGHAKSPFKNLAAMADTQCFSLLVNNYLTAQRNAAGNPSGAQACA